uniref:BTB domain-containing protein n=1 Tax=Schistocephalus solidus TaxID=70667 RepID=A0A0X3PWB3_SCHSO
MELAPTEESKYVDVATMRARIEFLTSEFSSLSTKYANIKNELDKRSCQCSDSASNFSRNLVQFVASLFDNQQYSDVVFKTKTNLIKAHRFVLEARGARWSEAGEPADSKFIDISYIQEDVARTFVKWLYTGDCEPTTEASDDFLLQLLNLARSFHLPLLTERTETLIIPRISKENFVKIFGSAHESNASNLMDHCLTFVKDIYPAFSASDLAPLSAECLLPLIRKYSSPFHEAARLNRIDVLQLLLTRWNIISSLSVTESVNEFEDKGETPLSLALSLGNFDVASTLLKAGASLSVVLHSDQHSLLQCALLSSNTAAALYLLEHKCQVEAVNPATQDSPLHLLCRGFCSSAPPDHQRRLLEELLLAGANTQILDPSGQSSLHLSILHQNEVAFQVLLANVEYCDVNLLNRDGISPLWLALVAHFVSKPLNDAAIRSLSNLGFAVDLQEGFGQKTGQFVTQLISAGANVDLEMITTVSGIQPPYCWPAPGDTALLAAARHGLEDAVLFLLDIPNIRTDNCSRSTVGESALHLAIESGLANAAYRLAKLGACPNTLRFSASHPEVCGTPTTTSS